eukprot:tig00020800_g13746.t1
MSCRLPAREAARAPAAARAATSAFASAASAQPRPQASAPSPIFVTGSPGVGKTTLICSVVERLSAAGLSLSGFFTEEERGSGGARSGFQVVDVVSRRAGRLATTQPLEGPKVGRYSVTTREFEEVALPTIALRPGVDIYVIDEVGKMECFSRAFVEAVRRLLDARVPLLATVALKAGGFAGDVRAAAGAGLVEVTPANRNQLVDEVTRRCLAAAGRG